ncbi:NADH dehydrogenase (ubiquinone) 1 alpha/beta subcomplex 1 [Fistulifera solaris]|uniref:Acyl carrier protein n=1 Tax=Fistulifera solaris TaxID=1519565 RepID=A0A1Z5K7Y8_FISSO|nr:NADH dehydrogenase (ubiquinone) 1 alpha/beta subcomplex 1 [Fistulifera solaris]|eukprot:GAX22373.1 NADH dehydrogenase (ubiquinone) 1 alpha/beta subcomplex 1 [Fistulifera solaris]
MFSSVRLAASRLALRATTKTALSGLRAQPQVSVYAVRHFSAPPAFLDAKEVTDRIITVVKNFDQVDPSKVTPDVSFAKDLGLDSLDIVEVVMAIEDEFAIEIPDQEADKITTIAQAIDYISSHPMAK